MLTIIVVFHCGVDSLRVSMTLASLRVKNGVEWRSNVAFHFDVLFINCKTSTRDAVMHTHNHEMALKFHVMALSTFHVPSKTYVFKVLFFD